MLKPRHLLASALLLALLPTSQSHAGGTRTFEVESFDDFDKGEADGAAIESSGKLTVGFTTARTPLKSTTAFSCLETKKGVYVGTADGAAIIRVSPGKTRRTKKGGDAAPPEVGLVAQLEGVVVSAMAELPGGDLVAATVPGGTLVRVDPKGKVTPFAKLDVEQVWALAVHEGRVLAATGPRGELWSLTTAGKDPKVILDVDDKNLLSLAVVGDEILAGTAPSAKLFAVADDLEGTMLHDFSGDEVRDIAVAGQGLVVAVNAFEDRKLTSLDALTKTLNRTSLVGQPPSGSLGEQRPPDADAEIYRVDLGSKLDVARAAEAAWERWFTRGKQYFTDILPLGDDGTLLVASSSGGKIYRLQGPRDVATIADLEERQTTSLCASGKGELFATTAHGGSVYQLRAAPATTARYRSEVFDAVQPATYGAVAVRGRGPVVLKARSGPSEEPDDARWSEWKTIALSAKPGDVFWRGQLKSLPHRRFLQFEVGLQGKDAQVRAVELFYAPENLAPLLRSIDIGQPSFDPDDDEEPSAKVTISWKVDERDGDDLLYEVQVRPEGSGDEAWMQLGDDGELMTKNEFKWDLSSVPDGIYEVQVTASDEPSNGSGRARHDELRSAPFVIDRRRPDISEPRVSGDTITATVRDEGGYVHDVAYSVDGGPFRMVAPADGLFDDPEETIEVRLPSSLARGNHSVVLRARDSSGNLATRAVLVRR